MKQKDILLLAMVVIISTVVALVVSNLLIGSPKKTEQQVETVQKITTDFPSPDKAYYNDQAINPTKDITIGNTNNPDPFSSTAQ